MSTPFPLQPAAGLLFWQRSQTGWPIGDHSSPAPQATGVTVLRAPCRAPHTSRKAKARGHSRRRGSSALEVAGVPYGVAFGEPVLGGGRQCSCPGCWGSLLATPGSWRPFFVCNFGKAEFKGLAGQESVSMCEQCLKS